MRANEGADLLYAFGPFVVDPIERRLTRDNQALAALPGKAWQILIILVEAGARLVEHKTLRAKLWPNVVVEDRTLTVHMSTLRKMLGAGASSGYIETVTGVGYRLAVPVRVLSRADVPPRAAAQAETKSLAVRAFSIEGLPDADTYLGVAMADAVTTTLGSLPGLTVSPAGLLDGPENARDPIEAARVLGVGHVLEGSVQLKDELLQVSARLIEVATGRVQWSDQFIRPQIEAVALQDTIIRRIASSLPRLSGVDHDLDSYRPRSREAYFLQLQGRMNLKRYLRLPTIRALDFFRQALILDPNYALAQAGLAATYLQLGSTTLGQPLARAEAMRLARNAAERALTLDARIAEAWAVLGRIKMEYDWDWDGAEADLAHAVTLNPSSIDALTAYGTFLCAIGQHSEAIEVIEYALRLDPQSVRMILHCAHVHWIAGDHDRAFELIREALALAPQATYALMGLVSFLDHDGRHDEAMIHRLAVLRHRSDGQKLADTLEQLHRNKGWRAAMMAWLAMVEATKRWEIAAMQWMAVGEPQRALDALERCIEAKSSHVRFMAQNPAFFPLRTEPRFQQILRTLKLEGRGAQH
jgi:DNA-binding winged helix-turn-helix (wHTH) protein/Tfp pilus assembly protein PilF